MQCAQFGCHSAAVAAAAGAAAAAVAEEEAGGVDAISGVEGNDADDDDLGSGGGGAASPPVRSSAAALSGGGRRRSGGGDRVHESTCAMSSAPTAKECRQNGHLPVRVLRWRAGEGDLASPRHVEHRSKSHALQENAAVLARNVRSQSSHTHAKFFIFRTSSVAQTVQFGFHAFPGRGGAGDRKAMDTTQLVEQDRLNSNELFIMFVL